MGDREQKEGGGTGGIPKHGSMESQTGDILKDLWQKQLRHSDEDELVGQYDLQSFHMPPLDARHILTYSFQVDVLLGEEITIKPEVELISRCWHPARKSSELYKGSCPT